MKKAVIIGMLFGLILFMVSGCGHTPHLKSAEDRAEVTLTELTAIKHDVRQLNHVTAFKIVPPDDPKAGYYGLLTLNNKRAARKVTKEVFDRIRVETSDSIDLFVVVKGHENSPIIEVFKPKMEDNDTEWDILY